MLLPFLSLLACTGVTDDTGSPDTSSDSPAASTTWYFGTSDGQTPSRASSWSWAG